MEEGGDNNSQHWREETETSQCLVHQKKECACLGLGYVRKGSRFLVLGQ